MAERLLVNFFYAQPVGHAIEALYYANGHHAADPALEVAVALNAATRRSSRPGPLRRLHPVRRAAARRRRGAAHPGDDGGARARGPDRIATAAQELAGGRVSYEDCLRDHFAALLAAHGGDAAAIWSIDGVHRAYVGGIAPEARLGTARLTQVPAAAGR